MTCPVGPCEYKKWKEQEKLSRTVKSEVCSIEIWDRNMKLVAAQISEILRGFVWEKVAGGQGIHNSRSHDIYNRFVCLLIVCLFVCLLFVCLFFVL